MLNRAALSRFRTYLIANTSLTSEQLDKETKSEMINELYRLYAMGFDRKIIAKVTEVVLKTTFPGYE